MLKMKDIVSAVACILLFSCSARAEIITLKSGKVIDGEIVEKDKDSIRVKYNGYMIYYENKYIKSIETKDAPVAGPTAAETQIVAPQATGIPTAEAKATETPTVEAQAAGTDAPVTITQKDGPGKDIISSFKKGLELASAGKFEEAKQEFQKQLNDIKGALDILDAAEKGSISKEYATYLFQGSLHIMDEEYALALASLEKAWEINPKDPDVNYNLGFVCYSLGEYNKSIAYLYATLNLQPDDTGAYELLAKAYYNLGEYQKAKEDLLVARELFKKGNNDDGVVRMNNILGAIPSQANNGQEGLLVQK